VGLRGEREGSVCLGIVLRIHNGSYSEHRVHCSPGSNAPIAKSRRGGVALLARKDLQQYIGRVDVMEAGYLQVCLIRAENRKLANVNMLSH